MSLAIAMVGCILMSVQILKQPCFPGKPNMVILYILNLQAKFCGIFESVFSKDSGL